MEIINWLRGSTIAIITLVRTDHPDMPEEFANKPMFTQWVHSGNEDVIQHINGLVEGLGTHIALEAGGVDNVDIDQNDDLRDKTPDCGLVIPEHCTIFCSGFCGIWTGKEECYSLGTGIDQMGKCLGRPPRDPMIELLSDCKWYCIIQLYIPVRVPRLISHNTDSKHPSGHFAGNRRSGSAELIC